LKPVPDARGEEQYWSPLAQGRGLKRTLHKWKALAGKSPLAQGRGLKRLQIDPSCKQTIESPLAQGRGLKREEFDESAAAGESPLAQGRGLKRLHERLTIDHLESRPSRRGAD